MQCAGASTTTDGGESYVSFGGRAGAGVAAVRLHPEGLEPVQATVTGGSYAAWRPMTGSRPDDPSDITATVRPRSGEAHVDVRPVDF